MTSSQDTCCQCGMEKTQWARPEGFRQEGDLFCCDRCAQETGCRCEEALRLARAAAKPIKPVRRSSTFPKKR